MSGDEWEVVLTDVVDDLVERVLIVDVFVRAVETVEGVAIAASLSAGVFDGPLDLFGVLA